MTDPIDPLSGARRQWLISALRGLALLALACLAAVLGSRRGTVAGVPACLGAVPCDRCGWNRRCPLAAGPAQEATASQAGDGARERPD